MYGASKFDGCMTLNVFIILLYRTKIEFIYGFNGVKKGLA